MRKYPDHRCGDDLQLSPDDLEEVLRVAAMEGDLETVKALLAQGVDPSVEDVVSAMGSLVVS